MAKGCSEEKKQKTKEEGKTKEGTPPWGRRARNMQQRRHSLWYDGVCQFDTKITIHLPHPSISISQTYGKSLIRQLADRDSHGNVNEDNFYDCFRYWEIRSLGVQENVLRILRFSKQRKQIRAITRKLQARQRKAK